MTITELLRIRQQNQFLLGYKAATAEDVVRMLGAVQAQDYRGALWAILQRTRNATRQYFDTAFTEGKILRTHVLRPTWHFVVAEDIHWMLQLTAPRVEAISRYYWRKLGLTDDILQRATAVLAQALGGSQLTRAEIAAVLERAAVATEEGRLANILMYAELQGVVCSGAMRGKQHTYALLATRAPHGQPMLRNEALTRLALRYFTGHGPATLRDYAWWSGLTVGDAEAGLRAVEDQLEHAHVGRQTYWFAPEVRAALKPTPEPTLSLLPNYDEYILAYTDRTPLFDPAHLPYLDGRQNPLFNHTVVLNGKIVGTWRPDRKNQGAVSTVLFTEFSAAEERLLREAKKRYGALMTTQ